MYLAVKIIPNYNNLKPRHPSLTSISDTYLIKKPQTSIHIDIHQVSV
jgi:hypothetical protein